ncbi:trehalose-phosphatase [Iningainema tapete]|uniref:Trehalose 6-phosphate phosphatase n=1 Tax=Iningainema tapete BLCC-T55 TaxID=2748662 RepID=A0A8J6XGM9_9CYAN|nr:trehalose-phosphatase [Iningainema tapete]MBD2772167.1 trehalose-phosphatase [Iningainema tapete BLCC-T55]
MKFLSTKLDLDSFFDSLAKAQERLLLLDYDGTLAPFCIKRDQAIPYSGVTNLLSDIRQTQTTQLVIISGRAIQDLIPLLNLDPPPEIWGSHGWEHLDSKGQYTITSFDEATSEALSEAKNCIEALGLMDFCEQKPVSLAIHWRGLQPESANLIQSQIQEKWKELEKKSNLKIHFFDGGVELRISGKDKGTAVESIICNLSKGAKIAYLGDDATDEDAFRVLKTRGLSVLVREELRSTNADLWIKPPKELIEFLTRWKQACLTSFS